MESKESNSEVLVVAKKQKNLLVIFFIYLLCVGANVALKGSQLSLFAEIAVLVAGIGVVVLCSLLAFTIFRKPAAVLLTILSVVPLVNLLAFLVVNSRANKIIKSHGFRVGLAGADVREIANSI
ncbi:hypothetical protein [Marinobacter arenosus]|uniref:hypothetical protein n=1 Tax=Marinobacter arenosus TaxID=2856822 RepID=UPI001C4D2AA4|nr:hypothetical protein [Marinobacter arenosus]MBW0149558.1 hypothetical protein [Marinobacter arenosus]